MSETWKPILGYEGIYEVSSLGRVRSLDRIIRHRGQGQVRRGRIMSTGAHRSGHRMVRLAKGGRSESRDVHRLVIEAFLGPCPAGQECRHLNGDPADNRIDNLAWGTRADNVADSIKHGTKARGPRNGKAKLDEDRVRRIKSDGRVAAEVARDFGVVPQVIRDIRNGRTWKHVTPEA